MGFHARDLMKLRRLSGVVRKNNSCSPQTFRIAPNQELGALALKLSKLVTSRNLSTNPGS
jgi:hypothetical protein